MFPSTIKFLTFDIKCFCKCSTLKSITFSSNLKNLTLGKNCFKKCSELRSLTLSSTQKIKKFNKINKKLPDSNWCIIS